MPNLEIDKKENRKESFSKIDEDSLNRIGAARFHAIGRKESKGA